MLAPALQEHGLTTTRSRVTPQRSRDQKVAGTLFSLVGAALLMGFITAEALYPRVYTTHTNTVSHLGATEPPNSIVLQPSAAIFDITLLVAGAMTLIGAWFAYRALRRKAVLIPIGLLGVGMLGVGTFPLTRPAPHTLFALIAFLAGGIAMIASSRRATAPFRYLWCTLGAVALAATVLGELFPTWGPVARLGEGGIERWMVYPVVLWLVAFGGYLLADREPELLGDEAAAAQPEPVTHNDGSHRTGTNGACASGPLAGGHTRTAG
jgi:hypothetical membrane protein